MVERFGIQDHSPQLTQHALQNPTNFTPSHNISSGYISSGSSWSPSYTAGAGGSSQAYSRGPRPKKMVAAIVLALLFGPFGVAYTSRKGAAVLTLLTVLAGIARGGREALDSDAVMTPIWHIAMIASVGWTILAAKAYNAKLKKPEDETAAS